MSPSILTIDSDLAQHETLRSYGQRVRSERDRTRTAQAKARSKTRRAQRALKAAGYR